MDLGCGTLGETPSRASLGPVPYSALRVPVPPLYHRLCPNLEASSPGTHSSPPRETWSPHTCYTYDTSLCLHPEGQGTHTHTHTQPPREVQSSRKTGGKSHCKFQGNRATREELEWGRETGGQGWEPRPSVLSCRCNWGAGSACGRNQERQGLLEAEARIKWREEAGTTGKAAAPRPLPSSVRGLAPKPGLSPWALAPHSRDGANPTQIRPVWVTEEAAPPPVRGGGDHRGSPGTPRGPPRSPHPPASRGTCWGRDQKKSAASHPSSQNPH